MNNNFTNSDLLVQYLDNELFGEAKLQLEKELQQSKLLQQELENLALTKKAVYAYGLQQKVNTLHNKMMAEINIEQTKPKNALVKNIRQNILRIAAILVLVLAAAGVYEYVSITPEKLFNKQYEVYTLPVSRGNESTSLLEKKYNQQNYTGVITQFETLTGSDEKQNFLAGQAYMVTATYPKAIACFNKILLLNKKNNTTVFEDDATYYLALSYLKNNQVKLAIPIFKNINNTPTHLYNDKVTTRFMQQLKLLQWKQQ
jgi:tetratricopeptide (TPR) repeat protein